MTTRPGPSRSNTTQILAGLVLGILVGYLWPSSDANGVHVAGFAEQVKPLADVFLRMIKMIIAPLLFSTLVVGIAGTGDMKTMGLIGLKAIVYFEIATTIALFLGLGLVNLFQPGVGMALPLNADTKAAAAMVQSQQHAWDILLHMFPTSVIDSMPRGDILQVVIFSMFFGIAVAAIGAKGQPVLDLMRARRRRCSSSQATDGVRADLCFSRRLPPPPSAAEARHSAHARQTRRADVSGAGDFRADRSGHRLVPDP
jgi:Na+/H+-dicarboxylate symporter